AYSVAMVSWPVFSAAAAATFALNFSANSRAAMMPYCANDRAVKASDTCGVWFLEDMRERLPNIVRLSSIQNGRATPVPLPCKHCVVFGPPNFVGEPFLILIWHERQGLDLRRGQRKKKTSALL